MREADFLRKVAEQGKISLVEPSKIISLAYEKKSESNIVSAKILLESGHFEESVSLSYFSMYNILNALLFSTGIKCENHTIAIMLLKKVYSMDNSKMLLAKKERIEAQYYVESSATVEKALAMIRLTEDFRAALIDTIERQDSGKIAKQREKAEELIKI
ncbi:MAG: HEPN domain-containing protein [Candidatus Woesearchaeota archaeon]|nr:HEPN domain-containing protein [Candidatus Woesearchaeota archaeon]